MALINKFIWLLMALVALLASSHCEAIAMYQTMSPSRLEQLACPLAWASDEPPEYVEPPLKTPFFITPHKTPFALLRRLPITVIPATYSLLDKQRKADRLLTVSGLSGRFLVAPEYIFEYLEIISAQQRLIRLAAIAHVDEDMFEANMTGLSFEP
ncbi:hypothetical protein D6D19_06841 [Aureobasidium pullulans]|uniref:Uncharacterized protein n=1 Tax=Aureobasidium pullulans TaxID=5580 RepID=A0A4V6T7Y5_AURPU|nr:hypothetical protein D6D29_03160 [Aureobasidium pullulans]THW72062.1 hypothetical protein D6D19_06841 [Aureobasidium pullulans]THY28471.1 hypothetical protein D6D00_04195 [Aureobasidium pullulans]